MATKVPPAYTTIDQGAVWSLAVVYEDVNGAAINVTGYTALFQLREQPSSPASVLALTEVAGITVGGSNGTFTVTATPTQTSTIPEGYYSGDLKVTAAGGVTAVRLVQGIFYVSPATSK